MLIDSLTPNFVDWLDLPLKSHMMMMIQGVFHRHPHVQPQSPEQGQGMPCAHLDPLTQATPSQEGQWGSLPSSPAIDKHFCLKVYFLLNFP